MAQIVEAIDEEIGDDGEEESIISDESVIIGDENDFDLDGIQIPQGPRLPTSAPNLLGLNEEEIAHVLQQFSDADIEDLFNKNTESFQCLAQVLISRSSLMRHILFHFPELADPGIEEAFDYVEPEPQYDNVGTEKYTSLCRDVNIVPISRVIRSLETNTLNLKYYGLSDKQWKAIASCVMFNTHIKFLILQDNWFSPESALWLGEMLRENNSIQVLNIRECRLGAKGIRNCVDGFGLSQSLREIDLSYNDLGDEGIEALVEALKDNMNIEKLNLGHNNLGEESGRLIGELMKEPNSIDYLDLAWNDLYTGKALKYLCDGLASSETLKYLNLSWNGIGRPEALGPIVKYVKNSQVIEHLDLSFNRLMGKLILMMKAALVANNSLRSVNLGFNLIKPDEALVLTSVFKKSKPLEYMDLQNVFVNKQFLPVWKRLTDMGKSVRIEGVVENYTIAGPNKSQLLFERCKFLAQKPKKKKQKKDFGSDFIWNLPDEIVDKAGLKKLAKKAKIKLDVDLLDALGDTFSRKKKRIELGLMRTAYLEMYPETQPPPPPKKKKGKRDKGKAADSQTATQEARPSTQEKAVGTDPSNLMQKSSIVTAKGMLDSGTHLRKSEDIRAEPAVPEKVVSTVDLEVHEPEENIPAVDDMQQDADATTTEAIEKKSDELQQTKAASSIQYDNNNNNDDDNADDVKPSPSGKGKSTVVFLDHVSIEE